MSAPILLFGGLMGARFTDLVKVFTGIFKNLRHRFSKGSPKGHPRIEWGSESKQLETPFFRVSDREFFQQCQKSVSPGISLLLPRVCDFIFSSNFANLAVVGGEGDDHSLHPILVGEWGGPPHIRHFAVSGHPSPLPSCLFAVKF